MEEENNMEKKRQIRLAIIGVVALLLLTLGATFAYFLINTDNSTSKSQINVDIEAIDSIALQKVTENLHVNLKSEDMAEANKNTEYFGDDTADYVKTLDEGMHNLGKLTATGGNGKTRYMCTANAVITMQVATENDMGKFFNTGDAYLYLNAGSLQQRIDLSELKTSGTKTIPFEIGITSESERQIDGYVEIINTASDQNYLADKTLNIDVTFQDLDCNVGVSKVETYLRSKDTDKKLTENLVNGMYRYQGNSIVTKVNTDEDGYLESVDREDTVNNNYICLGSDCSETSNDMYRILGVSEEGIIKVIKNTPIEQKLQWWTDYKTDIKWPESLIYQYLNKEYYNGLPLELKNKILEVAWKYGDIDIYLLTSDLKLNEFGEKLQGEDESAKKATIKEFDPLLANEILNLERKGVIGAVTSKLGLATITDYCSSFESNGDVTCATSTAYVLFGRFSRYDESMVGISWLTTKNEWKFDQSMTRVPGGDKSFLSFGLSSLGVVNFSRGGILEDSPDLGTSRPVFFLTSDIELSGEGTIESLFTIGIE